MAYFCTLSGYLILGNLMTLLFWVRWVTVRHVNKLWLELGQVGLTSYTLSRLCAYAMNMINSFHNFLCRRASGFVEGAREDVKI